MSNDSYGQRRKVSRQSWNPGPFLTLLRKLWTIVYSGLKIAAGALVTVLIIGGVCLLVFIGILGNYLENDILPNADATLDNIILDQPSYAIILIIPETFRFCKSCMRISIRNGWIMRTFPSI